MQYCDDYSLKNKYIVKHFKQSGIDIFPVRL